MSLTKIVIHTVRLRYHTQCAIHVDQYFRFFFFKLYLFIPSSIYSRVGSGDLHECDLEISTKVRCKPWLWGRVAGAQIQRLALAALHQGETRRVWGVFTADWGRGRGRADRGDSDPHCCGLTLNLLQGQDLKNQVKQKSEAASRSIEEQREGGGEVRW